MKSGFVAVVGRPNVGKSTLVNAMVGSKVAITSSRPQTTRNVIRGIVHRPGSQIVLVDTPGLHRPRTALGERLNRLVYGTLAEADGVLFLIDATQEIGPGDRLIAERLGGSPPPVIVVLNKIDAAAPDQIGAQLAKAGEWDFAAYVPVSATEGSGLEVIVDEVVRRLPEGPAYYPDGSVSDQPEELVAGEIIREKFLSRLRDELPHSLMVVVDEMDTRPDGVVLIEARVLVERESQKGMVIGKGGTLLRDAGEEARHELEALLASKVYVDLRVKVEKDWQRQPTSLDRLGF